jgi:hypothetical protein
MNNEQFIDFCENKFIIVFAIIEDKEYSYIHNVLINNKTPFGKRAKGPNGKRAKGQKEDYSKKVEKHVEKHYDESELDGPNPN